MQFRYVKIPEYRTCKEDELTRSTLSPVNTSCPVESKYGADICMNNHGGIFNAKFWKKAYRKEALVTKLKRVHLKIGEVCTVRFRTSKIYVIYIYGLAHTLYCDANGHPI